MLRLLISESTGRLKCNSPSRWNKNYLCSEWDPVGYACRDGRCVLQCDYGTETWCYSEKWEDGEWEPACEEHADCAPANGFICREDSPCYPEPEEPEELEKKSQN